MILSTFVKKCRESHLRTSMGKIAQDAWIGGWVGEGGGQPILGKKKLAEKGGHFIVYYTQQYPLHTVLQLNRRYSKRSFCLTGD